jgi:hypothetical protein
VVLRQIRRRIAQAGQEIILLHDPLLQTQHDLVGVAQTRGAPGALAGLLQGRHQHRRQDGNDGDHNKQLDQRKL